MEILQVTDAAVAGLGKTGASSAAHKQPALQVASPKTKGNNNDCSMDSGISKTDHSTRVREGLEKNKETVKVLGNGEEGHPNSSATDVQIKSLSFVDGVSVEPSSLNSTVSSGSALSNSSRVRISSKRVREIPSPFEKAPDPPQEATKVPPALSSKRQTHESSSQAEVGSLRDSSVVVVECHKLKTAGESSESVGHGTRSAQPHPRFFPPHHREHASKGKILVMWLKDKMCGYNFSFSLMINYKLFLLYFQYGVS